MSKLYRFDIDCMDDEGWLKEDGWIKRIPCDDGDYVLAEDALALQAKVKELEEFVKHDYISMKNWQEEKAKLKAQVEELERVNKERRISNEIAIKRIEELDKDKIAIGRNVQEMVREFDVERKELQAKVDELTAELENAEGYLRDASDSSQWEDYINGVPHLKSEYTKEGE